MKMTQLDGGKLPQNWQCLWRVFFCLWYSLFSGTLLMGNAHAVNSLAAPLGASGVSFVSPAVSGAQYQRF